MGTQDLINTLIAVVGFAGAWWINNMWSLLRSMQEQITALNVKLAEHYVPRQELHQTFERIFDVLEEIRKDMTKQGR